MNQDKPKMTNFRIQISNIQSHNENNDTTASTSRTFPITQNTREKEILKRPNPDTFKVKQFSGPRKFYNHITSQAVAYSYEQPNKILMLEDIPNILKVVEDRRRLILTYLYNPATYPLKEIIGHELDSTMYIHVSRGSGEFIFRKNGHDDVNMNIMAETSYQIMQHQVKKHHRVDYV